MKKQLLNALKVVILLLIPTLIFAQAPPLGTAAEFILFTSIGAVTNSGISHVTGNVGTNSGSSTGFGNVNGVMHDGDGASAQCAADLLIAYNLLNSTIPNFFPAPLLGNGQILNAGVYSISGAATMNGNLILNAQGDANAVFIFQIQGSFSTGANAKVNLINGALACNVFWKVEGLVSMAAGTTMRGTVIANNAAINMNTGDTLEGRALSTTGAVTVDGVLAYTPIGCGSPVLTGPTAPALASTECYTIFSSDGAVYNAGVTYVTGDVGTNVGLTTGFDPLLVNGTIHPIPDVSTAACAADLLNVYTYLNTLPYDIELLYPAQFGNNLVLTPHTYLMNAATTFTDTLYLNALGNDDAVFVIKIYGALSTSTYSKVILINGTQSKNVYWLVSGAVSINDYSVFNGTIVCNNGAIDLTTGVTLEGRALTTTGALSTAAIIASRVPATQNLTDITIVNGQTTCYGATQTIIVAGNSTIFKVEAGGSVTMVASQNIRFLPGTIVLNGGYLHAYITTTGTYCGCGALPPAIVSTPIEIMESLWGPETESDFFRIYPNPTNDRFTLETKVSDESIRQIVFVYSMMGLLIVKEEVTGNVKKEYSLADQPAGIYIVRVIKNDQAETIKVVRQ
ncbi:MAG: ice-binding family protein [Bacteroidota bacterium]